jgi:hypothetical protein
LEAAPYDGIKEFDVAHPFFSFGAASEWTRVAHPSLARVGVVDPNLKSRTIRERQRLRVGWFIHSRYWRASTLTFFFLGFFAFSLAALVLAGDFRDPPILPISLAVSCLVIIRCL